MTEKRLNEIEQDMWDWSADSGYYGQKYILKLLHELIGELRKYMERMQDGTADKRK